LFFIALGLVPLAVRTGAIGPNLVGRWPLLWPFVLIGWGIGLVLRRTAAGGIGGIVAAVALGLIGGGAIATGLDGIPTLTGCGAAGSTSAAGSAHGTFTGPARMVIEFDCGTIAIGTVDGSDWMVSGNDLGSGVPAVVSNQANVIELRRPSQGTGFLGIGSDRGTWNVSLPRSPALGLDLTLNAGDGSVDLQGATVSGLNVTVNAGSLNIDASKAATLPLNAFKRDGQRGQRDDQGPSLQWDAEPLAERRQP